MERVPGVASVRVSLNEGLTVLDLKAGNSVTLSKLRQVIRNNGFVTRETQVTARGMVTEAGAQLVLDVSGSRERLFLSPRPGSSAPYHELRARLKTSSSVDVVIAGVADLTDPRVVKLAVTATQAP